MGITVLVDDERNLIADVVYKSGSAAMDGYPSLSDVDLLKMDHDLGPGQDGYDVLKYILHSPLGRWPLPKAVHLVTSNPVGRMRMKGLLMDAGYVFDYATGTWIR
jgi:hypothetical protein